MTPQGLLEVAQIENVRRFFCARIGNLASVTNHPCVVYCHL